MTQPTNFSQAEYDRLKNFLIDKVTRQSEGFTAYGEEYQQKVEGWLAEAYAKTRLNLNDNLRQQLFHDVMDELVGFGPLQPLLNDPQNSEIMVRGPKQIYVERKGKLVDVPLEFQDETHLMRIVDRMLAPIGRRVDRDTPCADARLPDGSRVNIIIPPVSVDGPCITIRKFTIMDFEIQQLIDLGTLTKHMAEFLEACVVARLNILITGNTSSGKTTLLNILTNFIPSSERIITIEDAAELNLRQKYTVRLETKNAGVDGIGAVTTRDLVRNALRMRPDRLVVGEVRSGEAMDMLQAMNTGHDGSMTTLHANTPRDAIARIETMSMMAGLDLPLLAIRQQIASAIDLIVHMDRLSDGARKVVRITEVPRMEGDVVTLSDIFRFDQTGLGAEGKILGDMRATGLRPLFTPRLEVAGFKLRGEIFGG
ncbi:MAG TPA: type II secretion system protein E [Chloroflexi bacterium]|nr:type II secretion system protein E [Chloroflexota bacterium]